MAGEGQRTRAQHLESQVMNELDLVYLLNHPFRRTKGRDFYLHFIHVKMDTETLGNSLKVQRKPIGGPGPPFQSSEGAAGRLALCSLLLNSIRVIMILK